MTTEYPMAVQAGKPVLPAELIPTDKEQLAEKFQGIPDSTNAYMKGDKVTFNGVVYQSLIDGNVYSPEAYPAGWAEYTE